MADAKSLMKLDYVLRSFLDLLSSSIDFLIKYLLYFPFTTLP